MISHDQMVKALKRQGIHASDAVVNAILNDVLPNPQSGWSCGGVNLWGDAHSISKLRDWHHNATARLPAIEARWAEDRARLEQVI